MLEPPHNQEHAKGRDEPSDFAALLEHHRATERAYAALQREHEEREQYWSAKLVRAACDLEAHELQQASVPVSSPASAMPLQHTDLFQVGVMLGYLARTMRNNYQRRVSVPVSHRGDNSGGFDRFTVEDAELASAELLDRYAPDRVAAPVLPEPPHAAVVPNVRAEFLANQSASAENIGVSEPAASASVPPEFSSLPAVLGTLPRYQLVRIEGKLRILLDPMGEWSKLEDVARIVSALQHEIAQARKALSEIAATVPEAAYCSADVNDGVFDQIRAILKVSRS